MDGFYHPVQLGDTYALQLNYSGKFVEGKPDKQPKYYKTAVCDLELAKISPPQLDDNSFGQTYLLTAFVEDSQVDKLEKIAKSCDRQITGKNSATLARSISRQISADRAHLDSSLKVLENLSQTIQGTVQIEQTRSDRITNLLIASVGSGLAVSQVVCAIVLAQNPPVKNTSFYRTSAFQISLGLGLTPIGFLLIYLIWDKVRSHSRNF